MSVYNLRNRGFELQLASLAASILASALVSAPAHAQTARNQVTISTPDGSDYLLTNNTAVDEDEVVRLLTAKSGQSVSGPDALGVFTATYSITVQNTAASAAVYGDLIDTWTSRPILKSSGPAGPARRRPGPATALPLRAQDPTPWRPATRR